MAWYLVKHTDNFTAPVIKSSPFISAPTTNRYASLSDSLYMSSVSPVLKLMEV